MPVTACRHSLVVDEVRDGQGDEMDVSLSYSHLDLPLYNVRRCLICGAAYDRVKLLYRMREQIRARHRLPSLDELRRRATSNGDPYAADELVW